MTTWLLLFVAILFEVAGTTAMKLSEGFSRLGPSVAIFVCYGLAFTSLTFVLRRMEVGIAYAVWAGVGTALIAALGVVFFGESLTLLKAVSLLLVIVGVIGLSVAGGH